MNTQWKRRPYPAQFEAALERTYQAFTRLYPKWVDYHFDEHFLAHEAAHLLNHYRDNGITPDAHHLAAAWTRQMPWYDGPTRQQRIAEILPVAAHFLCLLEAELTFPAVAHNPVFDCEQVVITASR